MTVEQWTAVDEYFAAHLIPTDPVLEAALEASAAAGLPAHNVSPTQGKLLFLLARIQGARRILEIGTLAGYSAIWLGRALPPDGQLVTLEVDPERAELARANLARAGLAQLVDVRVGRALESLRQLVDDGVAAFDLIFIDADKPNNPEYLKWALRLARPRTVIIADNVVREGEVVNEANRDASVLGIRRFFAALGAESSLNATAIQTVGNKGYDGLAIALVEEGSTARNS